MLRVAPHQQFEYYGCLKRSAALRGSALQSTASVKAYPGTSLADCKKNAATDGAKMIGMADPEGARVCLHFGSFRNLSSEVGYSEYVGSPKLGLVEDGVAGTNHENATPLLGASRDDLVAIYLPPWILEWQIKYNPHYWPGRAFDLYGEWARDEVGRAETDLARRDLFFAIQTCVDHPWHSAYTGRGCPLAFGQRAVRRCAIRQLCPFYVYKVHVSISRGILSIILLINSTVATILIDFKIVLLIYRYNTV